MCVVVLPEPSFHEEQGGFLAVAVPSSPAFQLPEPAVPCMAVPCFCECCQPSMSPLPHGHAGSLLAARERRSSTSRIHQSRSLPQPGGRAAGGTALVSHSCSSQLPAPALLSTNLPLPAPTPGGSAIVVGDLNPTQVSFLREQCSDFLSSDSNHF